MKIKLKQSNLFSLLFILGIISILAVSCSPGNKSFNSEAWKKADFTENGHVVRKSMLDDLLANHLSVGMSKKEVIELLGDSPTKALTDNEILEQIDQLKKEGHSENFIEFNYELRKELQREDYLRYYLNHSDYLDTKGLNVYFKDDKVIKTDIVVH